MGDLLEATGRLVASRLRSHGRSIGFVGRLEFLNSLSNLVRGTGVRVLVYYWNSDAMLMALAVGSAPSNMRDVFSSIDLVHDETFGGLLSKGIADALSCGSRLLRWRTQVGRAQDLVRIMRSGGSMAIAVDGHGPYGRVGEPFARLVAKLDVVALPVALVSSSSWSLPVRAQIQVPRRGAVVSVAVGAPIRQAGGALGDLRDHLAWGLQAARDRAVARVGQAREETES